MNVIVVGAGKVGYYLAKTLFEHGHRPSVIEIDHEKCRRISNELDLVVICADGTSVEALEMAGAKGADALIGVTGADEDNLVACQLAKNYFNIKRTVARVNNPKNTQIMKQLGVDIAVSSTDSLAYLLEREVETASIQQLIHLNRGKSSLLEFQLPSNYKKNEVPLKDLELPKKSIIVSVTRDGDMIIPRGETKILSGDKILALCDDDEVYDLSVAMGLKSL